VDDKARIAQLERRLQKLTDRQEILDCIARHARGCDRFDADLLASAYCEDGVDEHGCAVNRGADYPAWANAQHAKGSRQNLHHITTHSCEIDGDVAHAESYVIAVFLNANEDVARLTAGRYVDRLERRDGEWRIALRRSILDVTMKADASQLSTPQFRELGYLRGLRDRRDVSYARPLNLDTPEEHRW
jgi:hypothetical protein